MSDRMAYRPTEKPRPEGFYGPMRREIKIQPPHFRKRGGDLIRRKDRLAILAFDPGGTTGWSLLALPRLIKGKDVFSWTPDVILANAQIWEHGELVTTGDEDGAAYQMAKMCNAWASAAIVVEDFILRAERKEKSRELLSPVRVTAKLEAHLWIVGRKVFKQDPSQGKRITDDRLALLGALAEDGLPDHARDADRHAVMFMRRCIGPQGVSLKRAAWPHLYAITEEERDESA